MDHPDNTMLPDFEGTQRFAIVRTLGEGSFGVVYEAVDGVTKSRVALKTLKNVSPESLYRLKREFRSLCDMAHPNLVQLFELFAEDAGWFFTMELVDGVPFTQYTWRTHTEPPGFDSAPTEDTQQHPLDVSVPRTTTTARADLARLENALPQLVRAVARLHRDGKLHRDLKPSNVLVTSEGRVVVLDFGLVIDYTADSTGSIQLAGTPSYMSPEQSRADVLTPASDWYSVGAIVYEVLTGEPPFAGEPLRSKQSHEPRPPGQIVRGIAKTLDQLCVRLLRLDPSQRPGAEEILEALERRGVREEARPAPRATFVGREADLVTLRKALDEDKADGAIVVCVEGVSGIGKSTFVRKFFDDAVREHASGDLLILSGRCYERESVPYKAVDAIIDELHRYLRGLDPKSVGALLPRDFPALAQLFPVLQALSEVSPSRRPQLAADSQEVRRRGFAALREMFQRMTDRMRVALFVDDLQWGDVDSADLLLEILRGEDAPAVLFIGAYRSDEIGENPFLRVFLNERTGLRLQRVRLEPLPSTDVRRLAESLLGTADARIAQLVADGAAGSPFLADTLVRALAIDESLLAGAETGVSTLLHRIVSKLDADPQRVLHLIAVNGRPLQTAVLQTALKGGAYEPSMGTLRSEHLVRTVGRGEREAFEIYHDRMREMIIGSLSERSVRRYHRVLIDLLEAHGTVDSELLAVHAEGARDEERAAKYLVLAAEEAAAALAFDRAARLYGRALAVTSDRNPRFEELKTRRADMLSNAGRGSEAAAEYLAVPAADEFTKLRLRTKAGQQLLFSGFIDRGLDVYRTVLAAAGMRWPKTELQTIAMFVAERLRLTLRGFRTRERDESSIDANQLIRLDTSWAVALGLSTVDPPRGAVFQTRHLRLALDTGEPNRLVRALATETAYSAAPGEPTRRRAEKLLRKSRELAGRLSSPAASAYADFGEGIAAHLLGEWQRGAAVLERAEETFLQSCTGVMWEIDTSRLFSLRCRWFLGDTALIVSRTPRLLREAEERGDQYFRTMIRVCLSPYARIVEDAADVAVADLEGAMRDWSPSGLQYQHIWYVRAMADVALYRSDVATARSVIEDFWPRLTKSLLWRVQFTRVSVMDVRARAALAAAQATTGAEREELIGLASKIVRDIEAEKTLWGKPFASIIKAAVARLRNDRQSAASSLVEAARRADRCSMRLYEAAARIRLAEADGSPKNVADAAANRDAMSSRGIRNPESLARMLVP